MVESFLIEEYCPICSRYIFQEEGTEHKFCICGWRIKKMGSREIIDPDYCPYCDAEGFSYGNYSEYQCGYRVSEATVLRDCPNVGKKQIEPTIEMGVYKPFQSKDGLHKPIQPPCNCGQEEPRAVCESSPTFYCINCVKAQKAHFFQSHSAPIEQLICRLDNYGVLIEEPESNFCWQGAWLVDGKLMKLEDLYKEKKKETGS
jgi:hypothetical protein